MRYFANYTTEEIKQAKRIAYHFLYGTSHVVLGHRFNYDARTRIGTLADKFVRETSIDRNAIKSIRKQRGLNRTPEFKNVLSNPLVKDYRANKCDIKHVWPTCIQFYGRNHHAKNEFDKKILAILSKKHENK